MHNTVSKWKLGSLMFGIFVLASAKDCMYFSSVGRCRGRHTWEQQIELKKLHFITFFMSWLIFKDILFMLINFINKSILTLWVSDMFRGSVVILLWHTTCGNSETSFTSSSLFMTHFHSLCTLPSSLGGFNIVKESFKPKSGSLFISSLFSSSLLYLYGFTDILYILFIY